VRRSTANNSANVLPRGITSLSSPKIRPLSEKIHALYAIASLTAQHDSAAVSIYLPQPIVLTTTHTFGMQTAYFSSPGDFTASQIIPPEQTGPRTTASRYLRSSVDVSHSERSRVIVTLGDSTTEGEAATLDVAAIELLPPDHAFWNHPAILLTPRVAGSSTPALAAAQVAENIHRALAGKPVLLQIDRAKGY
jgi:hypothetical protein